MRRVRLRTQYKDTETFFLCLLISMVSLSERKTASYKLCMSMNLEVAVSLPQLQIMDAKITRLGIHSSSSLERVCLASPTVATGVVGDLANVVVFRREFSLYSIR